VDSINTHDMETFDAIYHDDVVIEWPQSGEVIRANRTSGNFGSRFQLRRPRPSDALLAPMTSG
jgi:hypothetical protein